MSGKIGEMMPFKRIVREPLVHVLLLSVEEAIRVANDSS